MKGKIARSILLLSLVLTAYSCSEDEGESHDIQSLFTIHASEVHGFTGNRYIMASSSTTGEILFWDEMTSFDDNIMFDAKDAETVDITYASEYNTGFSIITYRNIKTEFKLSRFLYPCYEGQLSFGNLTGNYVDIILPGTKEIVEVINPAYDNSELQDTLNNVIIDEKNKIIYDLDNDITIINSFLVGSNLNLQFVFRFLGEQDYKSIVINENDWVQIDNENYKRELQIEDLLPCKAHTIDVDIDATWIVDSEVLTTDGDRIAIAQWSNYSQNQTGKTIKLFLQDELDMEQLLIKIKKNNAYEGFQFQRVFDDIPSSIAMKEYNNEAMNLTPNTYNYSTTENIDVIKTSYEYSNNNHISSWDIFQLSNSSSEYMLPEIASEFLDETSIMKPSLLNPIRFKIQSYSLETDVNLLYQETGIDRQLNCLDFNSSYHSYDF